MVGRTATILGASDGNHRKTYIALESSLEGCLLQSSLQYSSPKFSAALSACSLPVELGAVDIGLQRLPPPTPSAGTGCRLTVTTIQTV